MNKIDKANTAFERSLIDGIRKIDAQIEDYESRLRHMKVDREGMIDGLVKFRANKKIIEG